MFKLTILTDIPIICDDILSMGGTFIGLGKILREKNCGKLILFTSHADCELGIMNMLEFFDSVYTTNSRQNFSLANVDKEGNTNKLNRFDIII